MGGDIKETFETPTEPLSDKCKEFLQAKTWPLGTKLNNGRPDSLWISLTQGVPTEGFRDLITTDNPCLGKIWDPTYEDVIASNIIQDYTITKKGTTDACKQYLLSNTFINKDEDLKQIGFNLKHVWHNTGVTEFDRFNAAAVDVNHCKMAYDPSFDLIPCAKQVQNFADTIAVVPLNKKNVDNAWGALDYPLETHLERNTTGEWANQFSQCKNKNPVEIKELQEIYEKRYRDIYLPGTIIQSKEDIAKNCSNAILSYVVANQDAATYERFNKIEATRRTLMEPSTNLPLLAVQASCAHIWHDSLDAVQKNFQEKYDELCKKTSDSLPALCQTNKASVQTAELVIQTMKERFDKHCAMAKDEEVASKIQVKDVFIDDTEIRDDFIKIGISINLVFKYVCVDPYNWWADRGGTPGDVNSVRMYTHDGLIAFLKKISIHYAHVKTSTATDKIGGIADTYVYSPECFAIMFWELSYTDTSKSHSPEGGRPQGYPKFVYYSPKDDDNTRAYNEIRAFINKTLGNGNSDNISYLHNGYPSDDSAYKAIVNQKKWDHTYQALYEGIYPYGNGGGLTDPTTIIAHKDHAIIAIRKQPNDGKFPNVRVYGCITYSKTAKAANELHEVHHLDNYYNNSKEIQMDFGDTHKAFDNNIESLIVVPLNADSRGAFTDHTAKFELYKESGVIKSISNNREGQRENQKSLLAHATLLGRNMCSGGC